jgi:DNA-directed RNA polymerase subunit RPC12/RpoP
VSLVTMTTLRVHAADNLMRTGTALYCPDCAGERIFVAPEGTGRRLVDCGDYSCTDCGAAVSLVVEFAASQLAERSRVA